MIPSIGVVGAGAIGCYVGGLFAPRAAVTFVGRPRQRDSLAKHGLAITTLAGAESELSPQEFGFATTIADLEGCDLVLVAVKSADTAAVAEQLRGVVSDDALIVSLQNGVNNPALLRTHLGHVAGAIVSFNVVLEAGNCAADVVRQTTSGPLIIEAIDASTHALAKLGRRVGIDTVEDANIEAEQWAKLVVNLSNAIGALSGVPTRELLLDSGYRKAISAVTNEALDVLDAAEIRPAKMRGVPLRLLSKVLTLPSPIARLALRSRLKIDPRARSSMWQDLDRRRTTEVDFLNGEIVKLAARHEAAAPLNQRLVELVHQAADAKRGSPNMSSADLSEALEIRS